MLASDWYIAGSFTNSNPNPNLYPNPNPLLTKLTICEQMRNKY